MNWDNIIETTREGNGRAASSNILLSHPSIEILFLKDKYGYYWAFDKAAKKLCSLAGLKPYVNAVGEIGLRIAGTEFEELLIPLFQNHVNFAVKDGQELKSFIYSPKVANG